ncbi:MULTISPECIES: helix-turn-helix domain-containing protein [unclassified Acidovorax]|uniref:helix-turn-helix domain-containing protein n=1 Tax=unclassified Acidovorax TaxID=2684926 RepID=UPI00138F1AD2|nr:MULTISPECIES: helix-turn-helix transcriptional regulator [unclassified Acidovorax]
MDSEKLPPVPSPNAFASELIGARAERGLTQGQLSTKSGLSLSAIKAYEAGRNMPGARELRELCQALQISPNKLLFGSEAPFKSQSIADLLVDGEAEDDHVARGRASFLLGLLAADERNAVVTLLRSLALARHGEAKVREVLLSADMIVGMGREMGRLTRDAVVSKEPFSDEQIAASAERLDRFLDSHGHTSPPEKLPKK